MKRDDLVKFLDNILKADIEDSSSNGLQVQGKDDIKKIGLAVDACMQTYQKAVSLNCDMVIVHHGLFWGSIKRVTDKAYSHIKYLLDNNLNLYASHLPLDMNPNYGNNIELARIIKLKSIEKFGIYNGHKIGFKGILQQPQSISDISKIYNNHIGGRHILLPFGKDKNTSVGIISGGAPEELTQAIEEKIDLYITGEPAHYNYHEAYEAKINVIYLGHYESEKTGILAIGRLLSKKFKIKCEFIDVPTTI